MCLLHLQAAGVLPCHMVGLYRLHGLGSGLGPCHVCLHNWLYPCPRSIPLLSIANCLQWLMALITQASEEEIVQLKAKAEVDMDELINMYHQVSSLFMLEAIVGHKQMSALHVSPGLFLLVQHAILLVVTYLWWRHNTFVNLTTRTASAGRPCINKLPGTCSQICGRFPGCFLFPKKMKLLMQKSEGDFPLIGASVGLADCINSILWRGDLPAALCAIAVRTLKMDLRMLHSEVIIHSKLVACHICHWFPHSK